MKEIIAVLQVSTPPLDTDFTNDYWRRAPALPINRTWRGDQAPPELLTTALALWTADELWFGFECSYTELDMDTKFDLHQERHALWNRDVCEAFVRSPLEPEERIYKEFEVAPTGQWCDLKVDRARLEHNWQWQSGMRTAAEIDENAKVWRATMAIPFEAFGARPGQGERWQGNLFRVSRFNGERLYLALSPTLTPSPNFHAPERFIDLVFAV
jgi:hypothetical protein